MTTDWWSSEAAVPEAVLAARARVEARRRRAFSSLNRRRLQRRLLPMALAGSAVLATTGLADRFIQRPTGSSPTSSRTAVTTTVTDPAAARTARALDQLEQVLNADGRLVAGLAGAQAQTARKASEIAADASSGAGAPSPASGGALPPIPSVSLPSVPALPPLPAASPSAPPPSHAVTGASVVP